MARPVIEEDKRLSKHIEFRMTPDVMLRLKAAAEKKGMNVNSLVRLWVHERLNEEPRSRKTK